MTNIITTIVSVIMSFYHQQKLRMCIKRLVAVNDTLEQLGTPKAYQKMHMYSKQVIIGWIVYYVILNFYELLMCPYEDQKITWILLRTCILNHCSHINTFVDFLFIFFLWYIGTRFDKVNEHMRYLLTNKKRIPNGKKLVIAFHRYLICTDDYKRILWTLMHLHLELCRITRELNLIFGTQMTFEMVFYITNVTIICSSLNKLLMEYREELSLYQWFLISCGTMIFIVRLYVVHYICECVKVKAKKIDKIFHQLTNIIQYADIWKEIYQFILQAIKHPLKFTGMGLFYFGNDFLRKLCVTVLMYVIIMIQMKISPF
ncbi:hypothetical protein ACS0PU_011401 [Formica fusca]